MTDPTEERPATEVVRRSSPPATEVVAGVESPPLAPATLQDDGEPTRSAQRWCASSAGSRSCEGVSEAAGSGPVTRPLSAFESAAKGTKPPKGKASFVLA